MNKKYEAMVLWLKNNPNAALMGAIVCTFITSMAMETYYFHAEEWWKVLILIVFSIAAYVCCTRKEIFLAILGAGMLGTGIVNQRMLQICISIALMVIGCIWLNFNPRLLNHNKKTKNMNNLIKNHMNIQTAIMAFGAILGVVLWYTGGWNILEPVISVPAVLMGIYWFYTNHKAQTKTYGSGNEDGDWVVLLQVGRPMVEAVNALGLAIDALVLSKEVIGSDTLVNDDDYEKLAREIYRALVAGQNKKIHLFLSGPLGLSNMIGQLTPPHMFDMVVYHYDITTKGYKALPRPDRSWLN